MECAHSTHDTVDTLSQISDSSSLTESGDDLDNFCPNELTELLNATPWTPHWEHCHSEREEVESQCSEDSLHPAIAAMTEQQIAKLLDAPVWIPEEVEMAMNPSDCWDLHISKIAVDEEDYQWILHPNKSPVRYGYSEAHHQRSFESELSDSKIAPDDDGLDKLEALHPDHDQTGNGM